MTPLAADSRPPNEKPTVYRGPAAFIGGILVVLFCGFGAIDLIAESGTGDLTGSAILALVAVLAWLYGVYPAAYSWSDRLIVRNPFRTIELSWETVTDLSARLSFMAHTESKRFTVWAIPVSLRERRRADRHRMRDVSAAQRAAKRGLSADLFGSPSRSRRPADPITQLSFVDQAIAEMNVKREAHTVKVRLLAKNAEALADAARTGEVQAEGGVEAAVTNSAAASAPFAETAPVDVATVRWSWLSFALVGGAVAFLVVALSLH